MAGEFACRLGLDGYGNIRFLDEKARLDNFAIQLQNEPKTQGYIIVYAGQKATWLASKVRIHPWTQSVPPAIAGGSTIGIQNQ